MALWCSRLARQPVTLEVDGSSPFGVANKKRHPFGWRFLLAITIRTRKYNAAVRRTVARCGLDRGDSSVSALRKRKRVRSGSPKTKSSFGWLLFLSDKDSKIKYKLPAAVCLPPARWRQLLYFCQRQKCNRVRSGSLLPHTANQSAPSLPRMVLSNLRIVYLLPLVAAKAPWYNLYQEESA